MKRKIDCNMSGMDGCEEPRTAIFCHSPQSFLDAASNRYCVATWAGDCGAMNLYEDDGYMLRGELQQYGSTKQTFISLDRKGIATWLKKAIEWCKVGGEVPALPKGVEVA